MSIARDALDNHGLIVGVSPERFRAVAMPLLFDHLNAQCEGTIAVNRQARIVWINDKYAEKVGIRDPASVLGKEIEEVLPASRLREVVESGQPSMIDLMAFGDEHFVVTRIPLRDEDGTLVGALGFVLFDRARHLKPLMSKYTSLQTQLVATQNELAKARRARYTIAGFIGNSPAASEIKRQARRAAQLDATVLLRGETGTGKELLAQGIHNLSPRARGPFVAVNVAAIPESLVEAELFGTAPGAFTGADRKARIGKFEVANGGTLFLDEIESMSLDVQVKLLRLLQERVVERLGGNQSITLDIRVIAATKEDLRVAADQGRFRADLYYRLNVAPLRIPSLRERNEDILLLFQHFAEAAAQRHGLPIRELQPEQRAALLRHAWPGNVRELQNTAERFALGLGLGLDQTTGEPAAGIAGGGNLSEQVEAFERALIADELNRPHGSLRSVAEALGLPRKTLHDKLRKHGLSFTDAGGSSPDEND